MNAELSAKPTKTQKPNRIPAFGFCAAAYGDLMG